jgi:hypothetical protein
VFSIALAKESENSKKIKSATVLLVIPAKAGIHDFRAKAQF